MSAAVFPLTLHGGVFCGREAGVENSYQSLLNQLVHANILEYLKIFSLSTQSGLILVHLFTSNRPFADCTPRPLRPSPQVVKKQPLRQISRRAALRTGISSPPPPSAPRVETLTRMLTADPSNCHNFENQLKFGCLPL